MALSSKRRPYTAPMSEIIYKSLRRPKHGVYFFICYGIIVLKKRGLAQGEIYSLPRAYLYCDRRDLCTIF
jgi:hypothetical protein